LALWQTQWVIACLRASYPQCNFEIQTFQTYGDQVLNVALSKIGDKGLFTKELEQALGAGEIDFAVHSLKDLPGDMPEGLCLGAVCRREEPGDVLVSRGVSFRDLPQGAFVGTSSLRRSAQLLFARPDLKIAPIRGNIETRLRKLDSEGFDAVVLAAAGVIRLGLQSHITELLPPDICLSAIGQGAVAVECREGDTSVLEVLAAIDDKPTRLATTAERALMRELGGGCQVPVAALAQLDEDVLVMDALVARVDGSEVIRVRREQGLKDDPAYEAQALGILVAQDLRERGAEEILRLCEGGARE